MQTIFRFMRRASVHIWAPITFIRPTCIRILNVVRWVFNKLILIPFSVTRKKISLLWSQPKLPKLSEETILQAISLSENSLIRLINGTQYILECIWNKAGQQERAKLLKEDPIEILKRCKAALPYLEDISDAYILMLCPLEDWTKNLHQQFPDEYYVPEDLIFEKLDRAAENITNFSESITQLKQLFQLIVNEMNLNKYQRIALSETKQKTLTRSIAKHIAMSHIELEMNKSQTDIKNKELTYVFLNLVAEDTALSE